MYFLLQWNSLYIHNTLLHMNALYISYEADSYRWLEVADQLEIGLC